MCYWNYKKPSYPVILLKFKFVAVLCQVHILSNFQVELLEQIDRLEKPNFSFVYLIMLSIMYSFFEFPLFLHILDSFFYIKKKKMHSMILFQLTCKIVMFFFFFFFLLVSCFVINFLIMITLASFCRLCFTLGWPYYPSIYLIFWITFCLLMNLG